MLLNQHISLVQDCNNSNALAMGLLQSCFKPSIYSSHPIYKDLVPGIPMPNSAICGCIIPNKFFAWFWKIIPLIDWKFWVVSVNTNCVGIIHDGKFHSVCIACNVVDYDGVTTKRRDVTWTTSWTAGIVVMFVDIHPVVKLSRETDKKSLGEEYNHIWCIADVRWVHHSVRGGAQMLRRSA